MREAESIAQIDAKLSADILAHNKKFEKMFVFALLLCVFIFKGWFTYWLRFGVAKPIKTTNVPISVLNDPIQINYTLQERKEKSFLYRSLINDNRILIIPQAHYELSGLVVAYNSHFFFRNRFFDSTALYDLGASWGKMGDKKFYKKYYESYSQKNEIQGSRVLWTRSKIYPPILPQEYSTSHYSHSHIVPANRNVMAALLKIKKWSNVKIEGELVDMAFDGQNYHTSMSRTDSGWTGDRGNGSCETVYVTSVQIGNKIYK